jgi:hypothetical protein
MMACVIVDTRGLLRSEEGRKGSSRGERRELPENDSHAVARAADVGPAADRPVLGGALEALSGDVLKRRSLEISATSFITIISIILGVALALLAEKTFPSPPFLVAVQCAGMLLLFVCTFYYHLSISIMLRWAPSFADCALPFIIVSLEIPPIYFLGRVAMWDAWLTVLFLCIAAGVGSLQKWSPICHFGGDRKAQRMLHRLLREVSLVLVGGALAIGSLGLLAHVEPGGELGWGLLSCGAVLATLATIVGRMEIQLTRIYAYYGVNRALFN